MPVNTNTSIYTQAPLCKQMRGTIVKTCGAQKCSSASLHMQASPSVHRDDEVLPRAVHRDEHLPSGSTL